MTVAVSGRDSELASLRAFVASIPEAAAALVFEGEAGMGKTTLWRAGVAEVEAAGFRLLQAVPAESETTLSFSGIGDLLDPVLDETLAALPTGQKRALSCALVLEDDEGLPPDAHAVGVALLGCLRGLAEAGPVVVAVDDAQWLDAASSSGLAYAVRRLRGEPVGVLLARRSGIESGLVDELRRALPAERVTAVDVGPLDVDALHHVVQEHLEVVLPRPLLVEVHAAAGGNPFYALEIVRMLRRSGVSVEAGQPLPVPESLHELIHDRLRALAPESRDFLLAAAAHAHPTIALTETASGVSRSDGLAPALDARIVELTGERIRFTHPLLAAGAYEIGRPVAAAGDPRATRGPARRSGGARLAACGVGRRAERRRRVGARGRRAARAGARSSATGRAPPRPRRAAHAVGSSRGRGEARGGRRQAPLRVRRLSACRAATA